MGKVLELVTKYLRVHKFLLLGLVGVILLYVSASGLISVAVPWFLNDNSDELAHVDMIHRIYNGDIPQASDGLRYQPFIDLGGANVYQRAAGHPPLFHIIMAPFMGPPLNAGNWQAAIAVGRAINIFIGILCILALAWAGWLFGGKRKTLFAIAVPALAVLTYRYSRINTDLSMDGLLALWCTLTLINAYKIAQKGLKTKYLVALIILSLAGMATKVSYALFIPTSLAAIVYGVYVHESRTKVRKLFKSFFIAAGVVLIICFTIGLYYYFHNYRTSGNLLTPIKGEIQSSRAYQSYRDLLFGSTYWALFYARYAANVVISTIITTLAVAGYLSLKKSNLSNFLKNRENIVIVVLMILALIGTALGQLKFAHPYGSINFRYMLPAILPISLFLSYGLLEFKLLRGQLVMFAAIAMAGMTILSIKLRPTADGIPQGVATWPGAVVKIYHSANNNGVPPVFTVSLFFAFVAGAILMSVALFKLSKSDPIKKTKKAVSKS